MNTTDEFLECSECEGSCTQEQLDCRVGSASMCCGGCIIDVPCTNCEGEGEIPNENYKLCQID